MKRLLLALLAAVALSACSSDDNPNGPSSITTEEITVGTGATAQNGDRVSVYYRGTLANGTQVDTYVGGTPLALVLGNAKIIPGFQNGILGMKVGGKRRVTIPPSLGYGGQANGPIPANSTLIFEIDLLSVTR